MPSPSTLRGSNADILLGTDTEKLSASKGASCSLNTVHSRNAVIDSETLGASIQESVGPQNGDRNGHSDAQHMQPRRAPSTEAVPVRTSDRTGAEKRDKLDTESSIALTRNTFNSNLTLIYHVFEFAEVDTASVSSLRQLDAVNCARHHHWTLNGFDGLSECRRTRVTSARVGDHKTSSLLNVIIGKRLKVFFTS